MPTYTISPPEIAAHVHSLLADHHPTIVAAGVTIAPAVVSSAPYNATFADVAPGDYTVTAQAIDAAGNPLGAPVTGSVSIPADAAPAVIDIPASLSIQVS